MAKLPKDTIYHYESKDGMTMTITMAELVRCRDCKYRNGDYCHDHDGFARYSPIFIHMDDFCCNGEREDNEND